LSHSCNSACWRRYLTADFATPVTSEVEVTTTGITTEVQHWGAAT
jgi:hypothetical protein